VGLVRGESDPKTEPPSRAPEFPNFQLACEHDVGYIFNGT
jgi:hypothetical protein